MNDLESLRERAQAGDVAALTALGKRLLVGDRAPQAPADAVACLTEAARRGGAEAEAMLAVFASWGVLRPRSIDAALDHLQRAARRGWAPARRELQILARRAGTEWATLRRSIDVASWVQAPPQRVVSAAPRLAVFEGFLSPVECDWLIELARGSLRRAKIYSRDTGGHAAAETRTNSEADYTVTNADVVLSLIRERMAAAAGYPTTQFEIAKLLHYEPGQHFAPHGDFLEVTTPAMAREVETHGQRLATLLVYLNDDYEGGETDFPRIGYRHKGARGEALLFHNVDAAGAIDYDSVHAGLPPTRGQKWLLSQWVRSLPVNPA